LRVLPQKGEAISITRFGDCFVARLIAMTEKKRRKRGIKGDGVYK